MPYQQSKQGIWLRALRKAHDAFTRSDASPEERYGVDAEPLIVTAERPTSEPDNGSGTGAFAEALHAELLRSYGEQPADESLWGLAADGNPILVGRDRSLRMYTFPGSTPEPPPLAALSAEDRQRLARETADTINHTLAQLFLRLGPPPEGTGGNHDPVRSGGGGAQQ